MTKFKLDTHQINEEDDDNQYYENHGIPEYIEIEDVFDTPKLTSFKNSSIKSNNHATTFRQSSISKVSDNTNSVCRNLQNSYITNSKLLSNRDVAHQARTQRETLIDR